MPTDIWPVILFENTVSPSGCWLSQREMSRISVVSQGVIWNVLCGCENNTRGIWAFIEDSHNKDHAFIRIMGGERVSPSV